MQVVYTGELVRIRPFKDFAEFDAVHAEDYAVADPFRGPRWWPTKARELEYEKHGMLDHESYSMSAIERLDTGELVGLEGNSAYIPGRMQMNIGTFILPDYRQRGFGLEAKLLMLCKLFENYPLEAVRASTMEHHSRARAGLESCGMRCCGRLRAIEWAAGTLYDEVQYVIFREHWEQLPIRQIVKRGQA